MSKTPSQRTYIIVIVKIRHIKVKNLRLSPILKGDHRSESPGLQDLSS